MPGCKTPTFLLVDFMFMFIYVFEEKGQINKFYTHASVNPGSVVKEVSQPCFSYFGFESC